MASGSYKGFSANVPDLLLYGAVGFVAYSIYKSVVKPVSDVTGAVSDTITGGSNSLLPQTKEDVFKSLTQSAIPGVEDLKQDIYKSAVSSLTGLPNTLSTGIKNVQNIITSPLTSPTQSTTTPTVINATPLLSTPAASGTSTGSLTSFSSTIRGLETVFPASKSSQPSYSTQPITYTNTSTGSTVTRGAGSLFSNKGFN